MFVQFSICGALLSGAPGESEDFRRGIKVAGERPSIEPGREKRMMMSVKQSRIYLPWNRLRVIHI